MANIDGDYPKIPRVRTQILSMDIALGDIVKRDLGLPLRTYYEIAGYNHVGKSTLAYFLSSVVSGDRKIALLDLEGFDREYLNNVLDFYGYTGRLQIFNGHPHNEIMQKWATELLDDKKGYGSGIFDSVGAVISTAEGNGDLGEAFMGRRAFLMGQLCRRLANGFSDDSKKENVAAFIVNHVHRNLGSNSTTTAGGEVLKNLAGVRMQIKVVDVPVQGGDKTKPWMYVISGDVNKLRYGGRGRTFRCVNLPGYGISRNLSVVWDCFLYKLAERDTIIKLQGVNVCRLSKLIEEEKNGNNAVFMPFYEVLNEYEQSTFSKDRPIDDSGNEVAEMEGTESVQE